MIDKARPFLTKSMQNAAESVGNFGAQTYSLKNVKKRMHCHVIVEKKTVDHVVPR